MNEHKKSWPYSGHRVKRWKTKHGVGVFTIIPQDLAQAIKREALAHKKPQWGCLEPASHRRSNAEQ